MGMNKVPDKDDWRRQGQEKYLLGVNLEMRSYVPYRADWNHDHCEFCGSTFSENSEDLNKGYTTQDYYRWICEPCFQDFRDEFKWTTT